MCMGDEFEPTLTMKILQRNNYFSGIKSIIIKHIMSAKGKERNTSN